MKKKSIAKILAGAAVAALCVAGAVNGLAYYAAGVIGTAEIGDYAAGINGEEWKAGCDSLIGAGEAVKQAAEDAAAEKTAAAESAEEAETAQTAQKPNQTTQTQTPQTASTPKPAQNTQTATAQPEAPVQTETTQPAPTQAVETQVPAPAPAETPAPAPQPAPQYCGYCNAVFYSESDVLAHINTVHVTPAPQPAPEPQYVEVLTYVCCCGYYCYSNDEMLVHQKAGTLAGEEHTWGSGYTKVPA